MMRLSGHHTRGNRAGKIRLIQFIDFQSTESRDTYYHLEHFVLRYPDISHTVKHNPYCEAQKTPMVNVSSTRNAT
ncbi:MAG: hypothetical protein AAGI38_24980, partial [Bacteroidota bacterium]